jgi:hypothetical protein
MLRTGQEQCGNFPEGPNYYCWVEQGYDSGPVFEERIRGVFVSDCSLSKAEYTEANLDAPVFAQHSALHDDNSKD